MRTSAGPTGTLRPRDRVELLSIGQGAYYAATGAWALADIDSFQAVTGPKVDQWLVKTVGVLVAVIGGTLGLSGWRRRVTPEIRLLAVGSALRLAGIDVYYVARGKIARVYLLDAAAELALAAAWYAPEGPRGAAGTGPEGGLP